jgi:hypothetical protein
MIVAVFFGLPDWEQALCFSPAHCPTESSRQPKKHPPFKTTKCNQP